MRLPYFPLLQDYPTVILANGSVPQSAAALTALRRAERIVCCDGAAAVLLTLGLTPAAIVGDMDSLGEPLQTQFADIICRIAEQETNDLTKAVNYCIARNYAPITIVGAAGRREDHTMGNISLLAQYALQTNVQCITNYGVWTVLYSSAELESAVGQQVSIFALTPDTRIVSEGLKYPLHNTALASWWQGTLNEALGGRFALRFTSGQILVYRNL